MPTLKDIANLTGLTKMGVYNRVKAICKASPNFAHDHITIDVNHNNMMKIDNKGIDIIENYEGKHHSHKHSSTKEESTSNDSNNESTQLAIMKIRIDSLKSLVSSKDDNIRDKNQDIHDKKEEIARVHNDLANTQQLLKREQALGASRSHQYEQRISKLRHQLKELPRPRNDNKRHKKSFWQRFF